jgi:DNA-binding transcriptional LysR family regulator
MRFTLRQLEVFVAIAQFSHVSKAGESLSLSQSAASSALKELEQQYGAPLFDRHGKRLILNELGHRLRPEAEALLERARALDSLFRQDSAPFLLRLGATLTIGNYLAVDLMQQYLREQGVAQSDAIPVPGGPRAQLTLQLANTQRIVEALRNFEIDIGLIEGDIHAPELEMLPWRQDTLQCFCRPDHPLAQRHRVSDAELVATPWILREPGSGTRQTFDRAMHDLLPRLPVLLELEHTEAIIRAVKAGMGIACLSRIVLQAAFADQSLVPLSVPQRHFHRTFYVVLHRQKFRSPAIQAWLSMCGLR